MSNNPSWLPEEGGYAVLIGLITPDVSELRSTDYLNELEFNAQTAGFTSVKRFTQRLPHPVSATFLGEGKLREIAEFVRSHTPRISVAIFDDELSPKQLTNIEKLLGLKVIDRTGLILQIFADHAKTKHAKIQVEMAQYRYLLPRLTGLWTHLERQRGGGALMHGPGETQLETDRRLILNKLSSLKKQLEQIDKQKFRQRQNRGSMVRVALVGYTNVGKSTLMNLLAKSDVLAQDKAFATLDTTVRKVIIYNLPFLLSDTVGFIRKLPTQLIESFKSTLDEVREADLILHVADVSHPEFEEQIRVVEQTLADIGVEPGRPSMLILNKIDRYKQEWNTLSDAELENREGNENPYAYERDPLGVDPTYRRTLSPQELQKTWIGRLGADCVFLSATQKTGLEAFLKRLYERVKEIHITRYPYNDFLFPPYEELQEEDSAQ